MKEIGGINKSSLIDYPGKIACVIFTKGCNFRCPYCHNSELVVPGSPSGALIEKDDIFAFLERRKGLLDGVVISGGEPTLRKNLVSFILKVKRMGFDVKLDTNGSRPQVIRLLINEGLIDYIAMDIKTAPEAYAPLAAGDFDFHRIESSISLIKTSGISHEFRTTCAKPFIDKGNVEKIAAVVAGADLYVLQRFRPENVLCPEFFENSNQKISEDELSCFQRILEKNVKECRIR